MLCHAPTRERERRGQTWRGLIDFPPPVIEFLSRRRLCRVPFHESEAECGACSCERDDDDDDEGGREGGRDLGGVMEL